MPFHGQSFDPVPDVALIRWVLASLDVEGEGVTRVLRDAVIGDEMNSLARCAPDAPTGKVSQVDVLDWLALDPSEAIGLGSLPVGSGLSIKALQAWREEGQSSMKPHWLGTQTNRYEEGTVLGACLEEERRRVIAAFEGVRIW